MSKCFYVLYEVDILSYVFRFSAYTIMGKLLCGIILLAPILTAIVAKDWTEKWAENGEDGFDLDWFWMGSNLRSLGKLYKEDII